MAGLWELVKIAKPGDRQEPWILFKKRDEFARSKADHDVVTALPDSVIAKPRAPLKSQTPAARTSPSAKVKASSAKGKALKRSEAAEPPMPGAVKASLPEKLSPQLATLTSGIPTAGEWLYEIKFDGYRLMTRFENGKPSLITRGGHDWSPKMPP